MQDQIFSMLMQRDELTWQNIIYDLVKSEEMNPWDIDVSILSKKYLDTIKQLKEHNFFISGKIILASAILLKIKSNKLVAEELAGLDTLLFPQDDDLELENPDDFIDPKSLRVKQVPQLAIKTPQARKRKVSMTDLMEALEKALEVDQRRIRKVIDKKRVVPEIPEKKIDITLIIKSLYSRIQSLFKKAEKVSFNTLLPSERREDKIITFVPLLHLANQNKITLEQPEHFGDIDVSLYEGEIKKAKQ